MDFSHGKCFYVRSRLVGAWWPERNIYATEFLHRDSKMRLHLNTVAFTQRLTVTLKTLQEPNPDSTDPLEDRTWMWKSLKEQVSDKIKEWTWKKMKPETLKLKLCKICNTDEFEFYINVSCVSAKKHLQYCMDKWIILLRN